MVERSLLYKVLEKKFEIFSKCKILLVTKMDLKFASNMLRVTVGDGGREPTPASWGEKSGDSVDPGAAWSTMFV